MSNTQEQDIAMLENMLDGYPDKGFSLEKQALKSATSAMEKQGAMIEVVRDFDVVQTEREGLADGRVHIETKKLNPTEVKETILTKLTKIANTP